MSKNRGHMKEAPEIQSPPPYNGIFIRLFPLLLGATVLCGVFFQPFPGMAISDWLPKALFIEAAVVMKLAAPRIPIWQLAFAVLSVYIIGAVLDYMGFSMSPLFFMVGNFIFPIICVFGFGQYWVSKQYMPSWANMWQ